MKALHTTKNNTNTSFCSELNCIFQYFSFKLINYGFDTTYQFNWIYKQNHFNETNGTIQPNMTYTMEKEKMATNSSFGLN